MRQDCIARFIFRTFTLISYFALLFKKPILKIYFMAFDINMIKGVYTKMADRVDKAREIVGKPLTLI